MRSLKMIAPSRGMIVQKNCHRNCHRTREYWVILSSTARIGDCQKRQKNKTDWHGAVSASTSERVFQERCLKLLGHPSSEARSMPERLALREQFGNTAILGPNMGPTAYLILSRGLLSRTWKGYALSWLSKLRCSTISL